MITITLNKQLSSMKPIIDPYRKPTLPIKENILDCNIFFILNNKNAIEHILKIIKLTKKNNLKKIINIAKYNVVGLDLDLIKQNIQAEIRHHCITNQEHIERNMWLSSHLKINDFIIIGYIEKLNRFHSISQFALHAMKHNQSVIIIKNSKEEIHNELEKNKDFYSYMKGINI